MVICSSVFLGQQCLPSTSIDECEGGYGISYEGTADDMPGISLFLANVPGFLTLFHEK
jgi:hypothetical protein